MNNKDMELLFVLDMSGSMNGSERDVVGGFNGLIKRLQEEFPEDSILVSTLLFNTESRFLHHRIPVQSIKPLDLEVYNPQGCTALLDAVGEGITYLDEVLTSYQKGSAPEKVMVVIHTDGEENMSRSYKKDQIRQMIQSREKEEGWKFDFYFANIDAFAEGRSLGFDLSGIHKFEASSEGISDLFFDTFCSVSAHKRK